MVEPHGDLASWPDPAQRLDRDAAVMAGRLARLLERLSPSEPGSIGDARTFLLSLSETAPEGRRLERLTGPPDPLDRLTDRFDLSPLEVDLILLAGLAEHHEGLSAVLRTLHPRGDPYTSVGLAAQVCCLSPGDRTVFGHALATGPAVEHGILCLGPEGPAFERTLLLAENLWPVLRGIDAWPPSLVRRREPVTVAGLEDWLGNPATELAAVALRRQEPRTVVIAGDSVDAALDRAAALATYAGVPWVSLIPAELDAASERLISIHATARGRVPIVATPTVDPPTSPVRVSFERHPGPVVVCGRSGGFTVRGARPVQMVPVDPMPSLARRRMWSCLLPELAERSDQLAARYQIEPGAAATTAGDARARWQLDGRPVRVEDVSASVRARADLSLSSGVKLVRPTASWDRLVLSPDRMAQLHEAVERLLNQSRVLDEWGFLAGRRGARGVRMLFAGPPGTGKSLSAEVIAEALGADLIVVDISRVVSKWIGETEKNLAEVFDAAERSQTVLLFDEADALFGKRTEVSDAHDRYANLETAYLLNRLERFESLAVLATNLRQNIDPAFIRRLEFVVEFDEPDAAEREALWRTHLPDGAPVARSADLALLASLYPVVGGVIRNAAVAAAFLAAADGGEVTMTHFVRAIRREYEKSGRPFPGAPPGVSGR